VRRSIKPDPLQFEALTTFARLDFWCFVELMFLFVGSCVHSKSPPEGLFTSAGDAPELLCHMDAGYEPIQHVFDNVAYSIGVGGGILGSLKTLARGEIREFSDVFNRTRHAALDRVVGEARRGRANSVVGIRTTISALGRHA
jgi:uncharacterized protein YbjQ (UPF0145 family)